MTIDSLMLLLAVLLLAVLFILSVALLRRDAARRTAEALAAQAAAESRQQLQASLEALDTRLKSLFEAGERSERSLREEQRSSRSELAESLGRRFDGFEQRLGQALERLDRAMLALREQQAAEAARSREALEERMAAIQHSNETRLEQMRATVDEKLQTTLETRLGESFKLVSERLEQVHAGLGEMRTLATGVGDLKRVLGNVKTRGVFGEVQLGAILGELLTVEQYAANVATRPGSAERVEFAVKLPGPDDVPVWLPIDAKFPREDYERLLDAQDRADAEAAAAAGLALEQRIRQEAKKITEKYVAPPHSTDFAVLFLPTEGLYAEVLRRPGLFEAIQREHRVVIAGPTTLSALLNSLRMGFRTFAIEKRSSEVWQVLGAVRTEFGKFGEVLAKTKKKLDEASNVIDSAGVRSRAIERKLRDVEALDADTTRRLLGEPGADTPSDEDPLEGIEAPRD